MSFSMLRVTLPSLSPSTTLSCHCVAAACIKQYKVQLQGSNYRSSDRDQIDIHIAALHFVKFTSK
jgi:hypothetical protein